MKYHASGMIDCAMKCNESKELRKDFVKDLAVKLGKKRSKEISMEIVTLLAEDAL